MFYFDKKIKYLNFYEAGAKRQNAGYVKFQVRDRLCQMMLVVKGPRILGSCEAEVYLEHMNYNLDAVLNTGNAVLLGTMSLRNGQGYLSLRYDAENMGDTGLYYDEITGVCVKIKEYQYLESRWIVEHKMPSSYGSRVVKEPLVESIAADLVLEPLPNENTAENTPEETPENVQENIPIIRQNPTEPGDVDPNWPVPEEIAPEEIAPEEITPDWSTPEEVVPEEVAPEEELPQPPIVDMSVSDDKWQQLREQFEVVHPLQPDQEYLKLSPKNFTIFQENYQALANNSFLLHGYYNYKNLILGRKKEEGEYHYYLGVPGTYHDREKKVALMFGFEAFEGNKEPAENGDFGYYLITVKL